MTRPPAKRQRKGIPPDDDREPARKTRQGPPRSASSSHTVGPDQVSAAQNHTPKKTRDGTKEAPPKPNARTTSTLSPSPRKASRTADFRAEKENKSLHSFFDRATEEQRWARKDQAPPTISPDGEAGDDIEDDSLDEAFTALAEATVDENRVLDRRKTWSNVSLSAGSNPARRASRSSQKFVKPQRPTAEDCSKPGNDDNGGGRPWAEKFAPASLEELAVHKKKVMDVQNLLTTALQGRVQHRLLVLKGPAGSGKTTTVRLLSKALGFEVSEWRSPTVADSGIHSFSSQFQDFLHRGGSFGALELGSQMDDEAKGPMSTQSDPQNRVILIEDFPSNIAQSSFVLSSFRNALSQYLAAAIPPRSAGFERSRPHPTSYPPIVLIISESLLTSATAAMDGFTAHRLLGPDLCNHPYTAMIDFNPVAPTLVRKALELTIKKDACSSTRRRSLGPAVLKRLSELGDTRSAINGLEFLCLRGDCYCEGGGRVVSKSKRSDQIRTPMEKDSMELVTQREATLGIFHAVGKVIWNKRDDVRVTDSKVQSLPQPPDHLAAFNRPQPSQVDPDTLLNEIGTDIQTFTAALHENYILSTHGSHFNDAASSCVDFLSDSDLLDPGSRQMARSSRLTSSVQGAAVQGGGVDILRQNEISFQLAVRGLLFSLPFPVNRAPHPSGGKGSSFKMFFPASLKMWKPTEEIRDLVSVQMARLPPGLASDGVRSSPATNKPDGVESWKSRSFIFRPTNDVDRSVVHEDNGPSRIWVTRDELLLERLPYMARIQSGLGTDGGDLVLRDINKITRLKGAPLSGPDDEEALDIAGGGGGRQETAVDLAATDETTDQTASPARSTSWRARDLAGLGAAAPAQAQAPAQGGFDPSKEVAAPGVEKLYIEEDDIEDD